MLAYCIDAVYETCKDKAHANYGLMVRINSVIVITRAECDFFPQKTATKITALIKC